MNIKVKAGLEIAGGLVVLVAISVGVRALLELATQTYGIDAVLNGLAFGAVSVAAYVIVGLLYDIRVNQLKYKEKLEEMVKK
jgi:hypothetical protein